MNEWQPEYDELPDTDPNNDERGYSICPNCYYELDDDESAEYVDDVESGEPGLEGTICPRCNRIIPEGDWQ